MKRILVVLVVLFLFTCFSIFGGGEQEMEAEEGVQVALVGNQRFGDEGPMDSMAAGMEKAAEMYGVEIKLLESISAGAHEEDVRAMAREGYDLIITTFPPMSQATIDVAKDYPETKFAAIYQFINVEGTSIPNIWDTEWHGQECMYLMGALASHLSESKQLGFVSGAEEPFINNEINGFIQGVKATCDTCDFDYAFVGSFEDPAKAKEIALAMISQGIDSIQTSAAKSQLGVLEASKEKGTMFQGDVGDNYQKYPDGFVGYYGVDFGANVVEAVRQVVEDDWKGGKPGTMNLRNNGYYIPYDALERFAESDSEWAEGMDEAINLVRDLEKKIVAGEISVNFDPETPEW